MSEQPALPQREELPPASTAKTDGSGRAGRSAGAILWILILALVIVAGFLYLRHRGHSAAAASAGGKAGAFGAGPVTITTATARQGDIGIYITALGNVAPINMVAVNSRVQGQVMKLNYQEGEFVHAGDPLVEIDPGPDQAALTQAEGQLDRDSALLDNAKLDLERYRAAFASNAIPQQQLDTQLAVVHQYEGTVKLDQGLVESAKVQLSYCYITAPISGRVGLRLVDQGNMVQASGSNLVTIAQLQPISVIFAVAEDYLPQIQEQLRQGQKLSVDVFDRDFQKKLGSGTLETVDNQISSANGTVQLRAVFANVDESLFPNQFVNARLLVNTLHGVTLLPNVVIQRNADSAFVYTVSADATTDPDSAPVTGTNAPVVTQTVAMQTITVGTTDGTVSEVDGIEPGTVVAADNFNKLSDGVKVVVRSPAASGSGASHHQKTAAAPQ